MNRTNSEELFNRATKTLVGGVNSPVRSFKSVGGNPVFIKRGREGSVFDEDDNEYVDMVLSYGPMVLGHRNDRVLDGLEEAIADGFTFGSSTRLEVEFSELLCEAIGYDKVRFVNSGTEAVLSAIRLARGYTKRSKIIKFRGCYHGHVDALLVDAGSGLATSKTPSSEGVVAEQVANTLIANYNDLESVATHFSTHKDIAAVIIEPVAGNMGVVPPQDDFLKKVRQLCSDNGALLIIDEVMTGFRAKFGLTQDLFEVKADIVCLGKIIGGGLPVGAYAADDLIMNHIAPLGTIYQAGTLSGNPLAMSCGKATLEELKLLDPFHEFFNLTSVIKAHILSSAAKHNISVAVNTYGSMLSIFFTDSLVVDFETAKTTNEEIYSKFFWKMMDNGIYLPPSAFESWFLCTAHRKEDITQLFNAISDSFSAI